MQYAQRPAFLTHPVVAKKFLSRFASPTNEVLARQENEWLSVSAACCSATDEAADWSRW